MRTQAFQLRKLLHGGQGFFESRLGILDVAGAALELVCGEAGKGRAGAVGRQDVAWAGNVVAERGGRVVAEKDRAGGDDAAAQLGGVAGDDFAMLGSDLIGQRHGVFERLHLNEPEIAVEHALNQFTTR